MSGARQPTAAGAGFRTLRELGRRTQATYAGVRDDAPATLLVLNRFSAVAIGIDGLETIAREATFLSKNWHPNVARVRQIELDERTLTIASELIDGVTLEDLCDAAAARRAPLAQDFIVRIILDALHGLQALHSLQDEEGSPLGIFHGEMCPANVVIGRDGIARIVDVFRPRPVQIRATSEALGHAAPETLAGERNQDARADLYALGVMLWESLMRRRLYDERSGNLSAPARIAQRQREEEPKSPPGPIGAIVMRALAFDPALRFPSAQAMAAALREDRTIATAGAVAELVTKLAGERIRSRRADLHPGASGERKIWGSIQPPAEGEASHRTGRALASSARLRATVPDTSPKPEDRFDDLPGPRESMYELPAVIDTSAPLAREVPAPRPPEPREVPAARPPEGLQASPPGSPVRHDVSHEPPPSSALPSRSEAFVFVSPPSEGRVGDRMPHLAPAPAPRAPAWPALVILAGLLLLLVGALVAQPILIKALRRAPATHVR